MKKSLIWTLVKYALGLALLFWVIWSNWSGPNGLEQALQKRILWLPLVGAVLLCLVSLLLTFYRWYLLVQAQDLPFTVSDSMRLGLIGFALSTFLPGSIGGDIIKAACLAREQSRRTIAVATVVFDRIIGLCGLFWLVAVVGFFFWLGGLLGDRGLETIVYISWALTGGSILFWIALGFVPRDKIEPIAERLSRIPKIGSPLGELWRATLIYRTQGRSIWVALVLAFIGHMGFVMTFYLASVAINSAGDVPSLHMHFLIVPVGLTIQAGVPLPGGMGGGEVAFGVLYTLVPPFTFTYAAGVLGSLGQRVITWALGAMGYFIYLRMRPSLQDIGEPAPEKENSTSQKLATVEV